MTPQDAREIAEEVQNSKIKDKKLTIQAKTKELLEVSRSFIKRASEDGEYETMLCSDYVIFNREDQDNTLSAIYRVQNTLEHEGYKCEVHDNTGICSITLRIFW